MPEDVFLLKQGEGFIADALIEIQGRVLQGQAEREKPRKIKAGDLGLAGQSFGRKLPDKLALLLDGEEVHCVGNLVLMS
jgi:hypothetical protein